MSGDPADVVDGWAGATCHDARVAIGLDGARECAPQGPVCPVMISTRRMSLTARGTPQGRVGVRTRMRRSRARRPAQPAGWRPSSAVHMLARRARG